MDDPGLSSEEMTTLFGPEGRIRAFLEIEATLAEAQGELGLIPEDSARAVASTCRVIDVDAGAVLSQGWEEGTPLIPLLDVVRSGLGAHREYLHWETTTQDIVDTALAWRASQAIRLLTRDLIDNGDRLSRLAGKHRHSWMTGRTFLQAARPITFGARAALWLDAVTGRLRGLDAVGAELRVQVGGPVGLGSGMDGRAREVAQEVGRRLGLLEREVPWQSDREPMVSLGVTVATTARTMEKIANDLMILAQTEVGELSMRSGGSTAMEHKANPVDAMRAVTAARIAVTTAAGLLASSPPRLERDTGGWQVEWRLIGETFDATAVSVQAVNRALATVQPDESRMGANLDSSLGQARPDPGEIDRVVDGSIASFEKARADLVSGG